MANREALRELQARLAQRLQAAQSEGLSVRWLAVRAGGHNYLLPLGESGEIVAASMPLAVPYARDWFRGVLNVRGSLVGVVDLARFMAVHAGVAVTGHSSAAGSEASVVTLNNQLEVNCALQVDSLAGLRGSEAFVSSSAAPEGAPDYFGPCHVDKEGQRWQEIQLRVLAQSPSFLSIGA
jgi:twitching motility protein PilI